MQTQTQTRYMWKYTLYTCSQAHYNIFVFSLMKRVLECCTENYLEWIIVSYISKCKGVDVLWTWYDLQWIIVTYILRCKGVEWFWTMFPNVYIRACVRAFTCWDQIYVWLHSCIHLSRVICASISCAWQAENCRWRFQQRYAAQWRGTCTSVQVACQSAHFQMGSLRGNQHIYIMRGNWHIFDLAVTAVQSSRTGVLSTELCLWWP